MISYFELFRALFKINSITFGGGQTIAPVILDEFSYKRKLISEEEMLDIIALAQSGPGSLAVSVSLLVGYKVKGIFGALTAMLSAILPPLILISIIYYFYQAFASNFWVRAALRGMSGVIGAVLVYTSISLARVALKTHPIFSTLCLVGSFAVAYFTNVNIAWVIVVLALIGLVLFSIKDIEVK